MLLLALVPVLGSAQASKSTNVHALLFFQPFCDECFAVIDNYLVPLTEEYGERLQLEPVDVTAPEGLKLYHSALERHGITADDGARPTLVVGEDIFRGEAEILEEFPRALDQGLAAGGVALPALPELAALLQGEESPAPVAEDGFAMALAWAMFAILLLSLAYAVRQGTRGGFLQALGEQTFTMPWIALLALIGLGISIYLSYVELGLAEAACGPVGDCNRVQSSPYSKVLGIPMAFLGVAYYLTVLGLWSGQRFASGNAATVSARGLVSACVLGAVFSVYLTGLELFVIYAVCMWCLGSALVTALLTVAATSGVVGREREAKAGAALRAR